MQAPSNGKTFTSHFLVTSQRLDNICTLHVGVGDGRFVGYGPNSQVLDGIFGGVERDFSIMERQVTFKLEEDGKDINLGVKAPIFPNLFFLLTVAQLDNWIYKHTAPDNNPYIYIGFTCEGIWEQK